MEGKKYILIMISFLINVSSAGTTPKQLIYEAFIHNKMNIWEKVILEMETGKSKNDMQIAEMVNYEYGYIAWCIANHQTGKAKRYIVLVENHLSDLEKHNWNLSDVYAYKAALVGYKIGTNKLIAPFIGMDALKYAKTALTNNPENPFALLQMGNITYYIPAVVGGSKEKAIEYYRKAMVYADKNQGVYQSDWNYLSILVTLATALEKNNRLIAAEKIYKKILTVEPDFMWVKNELYPHIQQQLQQR